MVDNPDEDRFPQLSTVLGVLLDHEDVVDGPISRLEVNCFASGEASYRVWAARAEEPAVGYYDGS